MFRIAICDDNVDELNNLEEKVQVFTAIHPDCEWQISRFDDAETLLNTLKKQRYDMYILDIMMPEVTGIDLGRAIRDYDSSVPVIYTTSSREFAFEAFGVRAMAYLEKPIQGKNLFPALEEAKGSMERHQKSKIAINTKNGIISVETGAVIYVENVSRTAVYHMRDGEELLSVCNRTTFEKNVSGLSNRPMFLHPHKSFFVNMNYIGELGPDNFILEDGTKIPISRVKYSEMKKAYLCFMANGGEKE